MSFRTGTSADDPRASRRRRIATAAGLTALLAALLSVVRFHTVDPGGTVRARTAAFVWQTIPSTTRFAAALIVVVIGAFALVWLAAAVGDDETEAGERRTTGRLPSATIGDPNPRLERWCAAAAAALALFVAWRMGLFAPWRAFGILDTFASFDHPFHLARAEALLRSLQHGESLRWIANHQGGYPAEFYPFGWAWVEVALWGAGLGRVPMPIVHRLATVALFLVPTVLFFAMARSDRWPATVPLAAFALHVAVPGDMWGGGYAELAYVGLAPSVSSAIAVVAASAAAAVAFARESRRAMAMGAVAAAAAIWCNPRNAIALVVCVAAAWIATADRVRWRRQGAQLLGIAIAGGLLAAPEVLSLARFGRLYYFVRYTAYGSSLDYLAASIEVVSVPGFALAVIGLAAAVRMPADRVVTRAVAAALIVYAGATLVLTFAAGGLIPQLETTRLMPVQRLLTIYLAAVGLHVAATRVAGWRAPAWTVGRIQIAAVAVLLIVYLGPERLMPFWSRGVFPVDRSGTPAFGFLQQVLRLADRAAPPETAILVAGTPTRDRPQLWAPVVLDRLFFYDDWMWYWQTRHRGPYDATRAARYDPERIGEIFTRDYLERNAISAVVAAPSVQPMADTAPALRREFGGTYGLYLVRDPVTVVTFGGHPAASVVVENERIVARGPSPGGVALIRRNWFPRWRATVNGRTVPIEQTEDGYMTVDVPAGDVDLDLRYRLDAIDRIGRVLMALGVVGVSLMATTRRRSVRAEPARAVPSLRLLGRSSASSGR